MKINPGNIRCFLKCINQQRLDIGYNTDFTDTDVVLAGLESLKKVDY
jgi:hypothetical protein